MSLNSHLRVAAEGRFVAYVGYGPAPNVLHERERDIYPVRRNDRVVRLQVRGCVSKLRFGDLASFYHSALDAVRTAKHSSGKVDATGTQQPPDHRRTDSVTADDHFRDLLRDAAQASGDLAQESESTLAIVPERESLAQVNLARIESPKDKSQQKLVGAQSGKLGRKFEDYSLIHPQAPDSFHFLIERLKQRGSSLRMQHGSRMGIKSDNGRWDTQGSGPLDDPAHDQLMGQVETVKHAEGQDGRRIYCAVFYATEDSHRMH